MQVFKISKELNDKLAKDPKILKTLLIYGFKNKEDFMQHTIKKLNETYSFLNISSYTTFDENLNSQYHMYNGYIEGDINGFKEVIISFTTMKDGKAGNVFLNQQVMPMILSKQEKDESFLINPAIKKICLLTTHISSKSSPKNNKIRFKNDNALQMTLNLIRTIGFDLVDIFRIKNTNLNQPYETTEELINHIKIVQELNKSNSQHEQIKYNSLTKKYEVSFDPNKKPKGQTMKFLALKIFALCNLTGGENIDLSKALTQSTDRSLIICQKYLLNKNKPDSKNVVITEQIQDVKSEQNIYEEIDTTVEEHKRTPKFKYNQNGKKTAIRNAKIINKSLGKHQYNCALHDDYLHKDIYFKSAITSQNFLEGHHLIPIEQQEEYWQDFQVNLDCLLNVEPLCTNCHSKVHYADKYTKIEILNKLYIKCYSNLEIIDSDITFDKFLSFYNVYVIN